MDLMDLWDAFQLDPHARRQPVAADEIVSFLQADVESVDVRGLIVNTGVQRSGGVHWMYVEYIKDRGTTKCMIVDPKANGSGFTRSMHRTLRNEGVEMASSVCLGHQKSSDNWSCGYHSFYQL